MKPHLVATSLIRPPRYSGHAMQFPNIAKTYFVTSIMRSPHYKGHEFWSQGWPY